LDLDDEKWIWVITGHDIEYVFRKPYLITVSEFSSFVRLQCVQESSRASLSQTTRMVFGAFLRQLHYFNSSVVKCDAETHVTDSETLVETYVIISL